MTAGLSKRQLYYITTVLHCIEIKKINGYVYASFGTHLFLIDELTYVNLFKVKSDGDIRLILIVQQLSF